jgi:hypothetical protein
MRANTDAVSFPTNINTDYTSSDTTYSAYGAEDTSLSSFITEPTCPLTSDSSVSSTVTYYTPGNSSSTSSLSNNPRCHTSSVFFLTPSSAAVSSSLTSACQKSFHSPATAPVPDYVTTTNPSSMPHLKSLYIDSFCIKKS